MFRMNQMEIYAKYLPHRCLKTKIRQAIMSGCAGFCAKARNSASERVSRAGFCIKIENAASDPGGHAAF